MSIVDSEPWASAAERHAALPLESASLSCAPDARSHQFGVRAVSHPTKTLRYLRDRQEACERLADTTTSPENREVMLFLASRWRALADEDEAKQHPSQRTGPRHPTG